MKLSGSTADSWAAFSKSPGRPDVRPMLRRALELLDEDAAGEIIGYKIGDQIYDPADVTIIRNAPEVKLDAKMMSHPVQVERDADGTPLWQGERMVEVEPGRWMTEFGAAVQEYLKKTEHTLGRQEAS
jgi:hypothetical protein